MNKIKAIEEEYKYRENEDQNEYQPIENYGIIGDMQTVALVGLNGSIDFMCFPNFNSPSTFAALLDKEKGGYFKLSPVLEEMKNTQLYLPDTNILLTRFLSHDGLSEITDFMPVNQKNNKLIRRITNIRGDAKFRLECKPRFNYNRNPHKAEKTENGILFICKESGVTFSLFGSVEMEIINGEDGFAEFRLNEGESADFVLEMLEEKIDTEGFSAKKIDRLLDETVNYWRNWMFTSNYKGRWLGHVDRSALVLKLLISQKYGSTVASPTFGLPERVGGERNWDYRYTWIRDASFTMYALLKLGYSKEAEAFMKWIENQCQDIGKKGGLRLMYSLDGSNVPEESIVEEFEGYRGSYPVRIGNNAFKQLQLDIYGELIDSVYLYNKYGNPIDYDFWQNLVQQIDWVCDNWKRKDESIWEVRGGPRHFLFSRLMCWVAIDRGIKIAEDRSFPYSNNWKDERNKIYTSIFEDFWDDGKRTFVQFKGAETVDAALLLMPLVRFISPRDPRWLSTLDFIEKELISDTLVFRYRHEVAAPDALKGAENTFSMCSFWFVECLAKAGRLRKARLYFEKMLGYANHLGLYGEELSFKGEHLGNFPQAFTHLGMISAAIALNKLLEKERKATASEFSVHH